MKITFNKENMSKLSNQSLLAKLLYQTLKKSSKHKKSINYFEVITHINPRINEMSELYRSLKFLESAGLIKLQMEK